jgi:hypothetical protein
VRIGILQVSASKMWRCIRKAHNRLAKEGKPGSRIKSPGFKELIDDGLQVRDVKKFLFNRKVTPKKIVSFELEMV